MTPAKPITPADDTPRGRPLVVTDSHELLDDLLRLAAAAGTTVTVAPTARAASRYWANAPLVVVGADRAAACVAANLPPRSDIVLVGTDVDDRRTWSLALLINAEHVIFLPAAETWLVNVLSRAADAASRRSLTLGVLGGHGGAGSTTLAVTLARAGLRRRVRSALLEIDPFGGLTVGADTPSGSGPGSEASEGDGPPAGVPRFHPAGAGSAVRHAAGGDLSAAQARPPQARGPTPGHAQGPGAVPSHRQALSSGTPRVRTHRTRGQPTTRTRMTSSNTSSPGRPCGAAIYRCSPGTATRSLYCHRRPSAPCSPPLAVALT
ncbi:septum site-determining protein Ssd [Parafrankia sp. EUN1f]|uniref:septum site-determining protein Ssd n=1 Tax=Parafrankia sp. EUN1f TaxID=102897 RepID=UPI0001C44A6A|nr:septum site-determining protein Ssd [Parafrankia sp. EUN1f]EFC84481.1 hypothetical protein FrEUN1fDRAFT_2411 [Parafrankia sp. EUN1f]